MFRNSPELNKLLARLQILVSFRLFCKDLSIYGALNAKIRLMVMFRIFKRS